MLLLVFLRPIIVFYSVESVVQFREEGVCRPLIYKDVIVAMAVHDNVGLDGGIGGPGCGVGGANLHVHLSSGGGAPKPLLWYSRQFHEVRVLLKTG